MQINAKEKNRFIYFKDGIELPSTIGGKSAWDVCERNLFNTGTAKSEQLLLRIHYMFPRILLSRLKLFFFELGEQFGKTKEFQLREFKEYYEPENKLTKFVKYDQDDFSIGLGGGFQDDNYFSDRITSGYLGKDLNTLQNDLMKVRSDLENISKMYYFYSRCSAEASKYSKHSQAQNFVYLRKKAEMKLSDLRQTSMFIVYQKCKLTKFQKCDQHGLYLEEAEECIMILLDKITKLLMTTGGKSFWDIEIITGRGTHSKGDPVLFPKISAYLRSQRYDVKPSPDKGRILCTVRL